MRENPITTISDAELDALQAIDGCTVLNAIERFDIRLRNEGFVSGAVHCRFPDLKPVVGYAVTGQIRSSVAPLRGHCYYDRMDFWRYLASVPGPRVMVLQDIDPQPGLGAFVGEIHASIGRALDCIGYITNGAVRDLPAVKPLGFQLFSGSIAVSHSYAHLVDFGEPVEIGGLRICSGDLLHGDLHGVQSIPKEIVAEIPAEAAKIRLKEKKIKEFCRSARFSLDGLEEILKEVASDCLCQQNSK